MAPSDPAVGASVEVPAGRGVIRFAGQTSFAVGKWYGIELDEAKGKNDGSVHGVVYFQCKMNHGMFVRGTQIKILSEPQVVPPTPTIPRPGIQGHNRTSSVGTVQRTNSMRVAASPRSDSPVKQPMSTPGRPQLSSKMAPGTPKLAFTPRNSQRRDSSAGPPPSQPNPERVANRSPLPPPTVQVLEDEGRVSSPAPLTPSPVPSPAPLPPPSPHPPVSVPSLHSDEQELRVKLRVLEAKRADDARHIRELEARLSDAESFVAVRPKLQAKLNSLQTDLLATRRSLQDQTSLLNVAETRLEESADQLEMAMLDKEVAEERAEAAESELDFLKEKVAVVEVELNVLKEATDGGTVGAAAASGDGGKSHLAYLQLEKHNERLKDALIRLRDMSHDTEHEQRRQLAELEKELAGVEDLQAQLDATLLKLENSDSQIEELKMQLDDALGAEDMLVQLTEKNLQLGENIEEMRIVIEDLEALKELNDELEESHIETEKALQEDIDRKEVDLREQARKVEALEDNLQDYEGTITQFRDLVNQLTQEMENMRQQTQTAQSESATAVSQSAAMMSLNLKLQSSAAKTQAKNIDLELKKLEARIASELLGIVQPYLPQVYMDSDADATNCYLFFQRLAHKADLINSVVATAHNLPESLNGPYTERLVGVCEMRGRISHLSALCKRFASVLRRCDAASFLAIGREYSEIAPMEKRLDMHIDLLRREEFRENECITDVLKMLARFDHLAETAFNGFEHDLGERELDLVFAFDCDLDLFSVAIGLTKSALEAALEDDEIVVELDDFDPFSLIFEPLQLLIDQVKGVKSLSRKLVKRVEDLTKDSAALKQHLLPRIDSLSVISAKALDFAIPLAQDVGAYIVDVRASKKDFQISAILGIVRKLASSLSSKREASWEAVSEVILQSIQEASDLVPTALEAESVIKITGPSPWVTRVEDIKVAAAVNLEAERKVSKLNEEIQDLVRNVKTRDQTIQETTVKVELMERRMEGVKKQADTIQDLEGELSKARKQERAYEEGMEQLQADLDALEQENARLKTANANAPERQVSGGAHVEPETVAVEGNLETSHLLEQIESLRGAVRFLRHENAYLKGQDLLKEIQSLPPLGRPSPVASTSVSIPSAPPFASSEDDPAGVASDSDQDSDEPRDFSASPPRQPPTLRALTTETKVLYHDLLAFSSSPKVVDLSTLNGRTADGQVQRRGWVPRRKTPAFQMWERKMESERLGRRLKGLTERVNSLQTRQR